MSELEKAKEIIAAYDALVDRALNIVSDVPYSNSIEDWELGDLSIDGDTATVRWAYEDYYDDYYTLRERDQEFPASMLFISDEELEAMRNKIKAEAAERKRKIQEIAALSARERTEANELITLYALCGEYGIDPPSGDREKLEADKRRILGEVMEKWREEKAKAPSPAS